MSWGELGPSLVTEVLSGSDGVDPKTYGRVSTRSTGSKHMRCGCRNGATRSRTDERCVVPPLLGAGAR
jgi:hypothetical protein